MTARHHIAILVGVCIVLSFLNLGGRPLWNVDEGMHSATSKEMVETGDWLTPHHNGKPFYDKTALHNWFVAISFVVLGITEFAARLPAALLGLGTVLLTYWLGRRMYGPGAAFFGALVLATSVQVIVLSQTVVHDISLLFFVTAALALFYRGYEDPRGGRRWFLLSYVAFGFAVLAKGPIGLLIPGAVIFFFFAFRRDFRFLGRMSLGWGVPIGLGIAAPWFVAMCVVNPDYAYEFFVKLHVGGFLSKESYHPEPFYYYVPALIGGFLPWSVFLPGAVHRAWQRRGEDGRGATLFLLIWAGFYFLFFSAATTKLSTYILPIYPVIALLTGRLWHEVATRDVPARSARRWVLGGLFVYPIFLLATLYVLHVDAEIPGMLRHKYGVDPDLAGAPLYALSLGLLIAGALFLWGRPRTAFGGIAVSIGACILLFTWILVPVMNPYQTSRGIALELDRRLPPGEKVRNYHRLRDTILFYTDRECAVMRKREKLRELLAGEARCYTVIARKHYEELGLTAPILMVQGDDLLISNRED